MEIDIRLFGKNDANDVSNLILEDLKTICMDDYGEEVIKILCMFYTPDCIIRYAKNEEIFVALSGSKVTGTISLSEGRIRNLFIKPEFRGKGIGKKLMSFVENSAKEKNIERVFLSSNISVAGFYEKLGYKSIDIVDENIGNMTMRLNLMEKFL
jgi:ribosomal protein S18 acetylase RimI-like enzyme